MELPIPSLEQQAIIENLKDHNVLVEAVAGSGKTSTNLMIAQTYPEEKILLLTYSARLKIDTRDKKAKYGLHNLEVQSYHSFCVSHYDKTCIDDTKMKTMLNANPGPLDQFGYSIIILDETQDMNATYYRLVRKIVKDSLNPTPRFCILGDRYQSIFGFMGSDERYITMAASIFNFGAQLPWFEGSLSQSFRITAPMAEFVNKCLLKQDRIRSVKPGSKVNYIICDTFNYEKPLKEVKQYLKTYKPEDIFILAPSVRGKSSPVQQLCNVLALSLNIPVFVPDSDDQKISDRLIEGKLVFSSFHQVKGLERKVVLLYGFDEAYFTTYARDTSNIVCPNTIYVAATRALEKLTVFHHIANPYMAFMDEDAVEKVCSLEGKIKEMSMNNRKNCMVKVTDLLRHLAPNDIEKALEYLIIEEIEPKGKLINIASEVKQGKFYEGVSDITGTAIPAYFQYKTSGKMTIFRGKEYYSQIHVQKQEEEYDVSSSSDEEEEEEFFQEFSNISLSTITAKQLLHVANIWNSDVSGYLHKVKQVTDYSWLSMKVLKQCCKRLSTFVSDNAVYERKLSRNFYGKIISGHIDCIDGEDVWEFKCVNELKEEHKLQLALYMWLFCNQGLDPEQPEDHAFYLYNVLDGQMFRIYATRKMLDKLVQFLLIAKYGVKKSISDAQFMKDHNV